ncbi:MAG: DUF4202 domain-containing protein [Dehalococcoidia bacterium]|nr:DUF4202 domain-containing protein [Dehalococcoidia bacterium]
MEEGFGPRFAAAIAAIDVANSADPNTIATADGPRPKEPTHAEMMTRWVRRLAAAPSEALLLAARAHHIRRWEVPRSSYPAGRHGYLRWRSDLHRFHAETTAAILRECGYDEATITRVSDIIQKRNLRDDPEVQVFEDALNLVFLETQFHEFRGRHEAEKLAGIIRKTWRKMSPAGQAQALQLDLPAEDRAFVEHALSQE